VMALPLEMYGQGSLELCSSGHLWYPILCEGREGLVAEVPAVLMAVLVVLAQGEFDSSPRARVEAGRRWEPSRRAEEPCGQTPQTWFRRQARQRRLMAGSASNQERCWSHRGGLLSRSIGRSTVQRWVFSSVVNGKKDVSSKASNGSLRRRMEKAATKGMVSSGI
jgi:hypothetical protein